MQKNTFFRKRWLDFRNGHSIYLGYTLNFVNFLLITYNFAVKNVPLLHDVFNNLLLFSLFFAGVYIPASMMLGYWHRRNQYIVENEAMLAENWIWAWLTRYQILLIEGKTTPEENKEVLSYLENILKRHKMDHFIRSDSAEAMSNARLNSMGKSLSVPTGQRKSDEEIEPPSS